jgi:hypothetical protein
MRSRHLLRCGVAACLSVATWSAPAQDFAAAKTFLKIVYARYHKNGPGVEATGPRATRYLHSSLVALIREDARAVGQDEVGVLDGDPLCGCQDWEGIYGLQIDVREPVASRAEAIVSFALFERAKPEDMRRLVITLAKERGAWRVYNVVDRSDAKAAFDLRKELEKEIAQKQNLSPHSPTGKPSAVPGQAREHQNN